MAPCLANPSYSLYTYTRNLMSLAIVGACLGEYGVTIVGARVLNLDSFLFCGKCTERFTTAVVEPPIERHKPMVLYQ